MKYFVAVLAILMVAGTTVVLTAGSAAAPSPKKMALACAVKDSGKLQYVGKAADCPTSRGKLVHFPQDRPVHACQLDKANSGTKRLALPPPAHPHNVKGMLFRVGGTGACHGPKYPDSHHVVLPKATDLKLCAGKRHGTVRVVNNYSQCNDLEFAAVLKAVPAPQNRAPKANDQKVDVNENTPKSITLTGSDPDGDALTFTIAQQPSHGTLSGSGRNRTYTPATGYSGPDSFKFKVSDGHGHSNTGNVTITVHNVNDAPIINTSAGATPYTEGASAVAIDSALTVTDSDSSTLTGATVKISGAFQAGDALSFVDELGITGGYDSGTGVLTLTGTAPVSDYQQALRDVKFSSTNDAPTTPKTIQFQASDATSTGPPASKSITVAPVNDAPTITTTATNLTYTEGDGAVAIDSGLTAGDPDSTNFQGATVQITGNFSSADDQLSFDNTATPSITGLYDDTTGTMTLSGTDTVAHYQAALRAVKFENTNANPSGSKTVSFQATDSGGAASDAATRQIDLQNANTAPTVTTSGGTLAYTEGDTAKVVDPGVTVTDPDDANLASAKVRISVGFQAGDALQFTDTATIDGDYDSSTGVLTLTGSDTVAAYQSALQSVKFVTTSENPPTSKTVEFTVDDGHATNHASNAATRGIAITPVNDAPTIATTVANLSYTEGDGPKAIDSGLTADDPDSGTLAGATVKISSNFSSDDDELSFDNTATPGITGLYDDTTGTLTLSGTDTVAHYQSALRAVKYENVSTNPSGTKTVSFQADDGSAFNNLSNVAMRTIDLQNANTAPTVNTTGDPLGYTEGDAATAVDDAVTVTDPDDTNLASATVTISANFQLGDDLQFTDTATIDGDYDSSTGVLTLTGSDTVAAYQSALRSVKFVTTNDDPSTSKTVEFAVDDGHATNHASSPATRSIVITPVNDAPTITTTATNLTYTEGDGAVAIDSGLTANDPDSATLVGATVQITSNFVSADDELTFDNTATPGITGLYDDSTGTMTLSGTDTVAHYQAALRAVKFTNTNQNPSGSKEVSFQADDGAAANNLSNVAKRTIDLQNANTAPTVTTTSGDTAYQEGDVAKIVDPGVTVSDPDDTNLASATVTISANLQTGDALEFTDTATIDGDYDSGTGVLTLTGSDTLAAYQSALQSVKFVTTNDNPSASKTVEFVVDDGHATNHASSPATKGIAITPVNDGPTITTDATNLAYAEGDGPKAIDPELLLTDPDSTNLSEAKVTISGNFVAADDELSFDNTATPGITGLYDDGTGVLTLSGADTVAHYRTALRAVKYENVNQSPSGSKTISFDAKDDLLAPSNTATRTIDLTAVNDAPVVTTTSGDTTYTEGDPAVTVDSGVTVSDADDANLASGQVRISTGFQLGDSLTFTNTGSVNGNYNATTGVLAITGSDTLANYQTFLKSVKFSSTNPVPSSSKTVEFTVDDGHAANHASNAATKGLAITSINTAPTVTAGGTLSYTENDPATTVAPALTVVEPEGEPLQSASASINSNFQAGEDALSWTDNNTLDTIVQGPSTNQTINLTGVGTDAEYQAALRAVKYTNSSQAPSSLTRTVTFAATDAIGATGSDTRDIAVTPVDDPPVANDDLGAVVTEDAVGTQILVEANDTDVDGGAMTITNVTDPPHGTTSIGGGGTTVVYNPDADYCNDPPGTSPDTFTYTLNGGDTADVTVKVTCVNDNPVAQDKTYTTTQSAIGNTTFVGNDLSDGAPATPDPTDTSPVTDRPHKTVTSDIRDTATDVDNTQSSLTLVPETKATTDGGTVTIQSDGDFVYEPKASTSCTDHQDSFTYTVTDNSSPTAGTDTGTVTIDIASCVRYVNNDDAEGSSGTSEKPYDTLAAAQSGSSPGDYIFVYDGNDTTTGYDAGIDLQANQKLIGEAANLTVGADTIHTADAANRPTITDSATDVVVMDDGNDVKGIEVDPSGGANGGGIAAGAGDVSGNIDDVRVIDDDGVGAQQAGLEIDSSTGTWNVSNIDVQVTSGATGVRVNNVPSPHVVNFSSASNNKSTSAGGKALDVTGTVGTPTNLGASSMFRFLQSTNSNAGGVGIVNATGTLALGDGISSDLELNTTSGASAGLLLINAGNVSVPSAGTSNIHATGGPAVDVSSTSGVSLPLDTVDSTSSATDGINFDGNGTGTFSAASGGATGIKGAAGVAVDVNGGSGDFTYPGKLDDGTGATADITNRTGGTVTLSGAITDGSDTGGGITLSGNTGGATDITNATKTLNTVSGNALTMSSPSGSTHALTLSGGGLNIDTTSGKGLEANTTSGSGGTIEVSGTGNTIDTGTGRALHISDTGIAAGDATFQHIASNGAVNGIRLNNTGSTGNLAVTGTGTAGSGGTIQSSTDNGIDVNSVAGGLSLTSMNLTSNGNAAGDSGLGGTQLTGTVNLVSDNFTNNFDSGVRLSNASGTLNMNVNGAGSVYSGAGTSGGAGDGIFVEGTSTGSQNLNISGTAANPIVFSGNKDSHVQHTSDSANTTDSDVTIDHASMSEPDDNVATQLGGGITINHGGNANVDATVTNNNIQNSIIGAIAVDTTGSVSDQQQAAIDATIQNNIIGTTGDDGSGSSQGNGIFVSSNGAGHVRTNITGNDVRQWTNRNGLELDVLDGPAKLDATVKDNHFNEPNSAFAGTTTRGFTFQLGAAQAGDNIQACLDIGDLNTSLDNEVAGTGESPQPDIRYLYEGPSTGGPSSVKLANYGGPSTPTITDIASYLQPRNDDGGTPTVTGTAAPTGTSSTTSVASCPLPAP